MDFFACLLLKSDLSINDLKQYYSKASFNPAKITSKNTVILEVTQLKRKKLESEYVENQDVYFKLKAGEDYSKYYVLMLYDGGYPAGFDIRGN